jgi:hypothetical protein
MQASLSLRTPAGMRPTSADSDSSSLKPSMKAYLLMSLGATERYLRPARGASAAAQLASPARRRLTHAMAASYSIHIAPIAHCLYASMPQAMGLHVVVS